MCMLTKGSAPESRQKPDLMPVSAPEDMDATQMNSEIK